MLVSVSLVLWLYPLYANPEKLIWLNSVLSEKMLKTTILALFLLLFHMVIQRDGLFFCLQYQCIVMYVEVNRMVYYTYLL